MVVNRKVTGKAMSLPLGIGLGVMISVIVTLLGTVVLTYLISRESVTQEGIGLGCGIILVIASFLGDICACAGIKRRWLMVCAVCSAGYYLVLLAVTALFFGGQYHGILTGAILILIGSAVAALAGMKGKNGLKRRRKIPAYR